MNAREPSEGGDAAGFDAARFVSGRDAYIDCERAIRRQIAELDRAAATVPDFLIIGAPRAGTTFLFALLAETGQIHLPAGKELKFFTANIVKWDLAAYLHQFRAGAGKICGEASPSYAVLPKGRIELVHELNSRMKIIYMLREPSARAASEWKHNRRDGAPWTPMDLASFVASDGALMQADYAANLGRWLDVFPAQQVRPIFYESISRRPEAVFRETLDFLGAAQVDLPSRSFMLPHNATWDDPGLQAAIETMAPYLYGPRTRRLRTLLSQAYPALERPAWVEDATLPADGGLLVLHELDPARSLAVTADGGFLCGPRASLDALPARGGATLAAVRDLRLGFGRFISEAVVHALMLDGIVDWKLYANINGDRWGGDYFVVREAYFGWHVLSYRGVFFAVRDSAGMVDLRRVPRDDLQRMADSGDLAEFDSLEAALEHAAADWRRRRLPAPPGDSPERVGVLRAAIQWTRRLPCRAVRGVAYRAVWMMRSIIEPETLRRTLNHIARWCSG